MNSQVKMEKPKSKRTKTIQMKYPAPYSQSWVTPETARGRKKHKKSMPLLQGNTFSNCCQRNRVRPLHGCDPYAPHLKYGIFPQRRGPKTRSQMTAINSRPGLDVALVPKHTSRANHKRQHNKGHLTEEPLFVIRPIDKRHKRQLSISETLHLDIRPRRNTYRSPTRKYSPIFKHAIPKMNAPISY